MSLFNRKSPLRHSYDTVAKEYARRIHGELADKPADRRLLDQFADALPGIPPARLTAAATAGS